MGGDGAAGPAGDPVRSTRAGRTSSRVLFGNFFGGSIMIAQQHAALADDGARNGTVPRAFVLHGSSSAAVLARARRHRRRVVPVHPAPPICRRRSASAAARSTRCSSTTTTSTASTTGSSPAASAASARCFPNVGDRSIIDGFFVNGSARVVAHAAVLLRQIQSGSRLPLRLRHDPRRSCVLPGLVA